MEKTIRFRSKTYNGSLESVINKINSSISLYNKKALQVTISIQVKKTGEKYFIEGQEHNYTAEVKEVHPQDFYSKQSSIDLENCRLQFEKLKYNTVGYLFIVDDNI